MEFLEVNPFEIDSREYCLFEQAKVAQSTIDVIKKSELDEIALGMIANLESDRDMYLEEIGG